MSATKKNDSATAKKDFPKVYPAQDFMGQEFTCSMTPKGKKTVFLFEAIQT